MTVLEVVIRPRGRVHLSKRNRQAKPITPQKDFFGSGTVRHCEEGPVGGHYEVVQLDRPGTRRAPRDDRMDGTPIPPAAVFSRTAFR